MKTQMKFQKRLCLGLVILGALFIVYGIMYKTGMLAALGSLCDKTRGTVYTDLQYGADFSKAELFYTTDSFNTALFWLGIVDLLLACCLYVTATNKRRNYYVSNYITSLIVAVADFAMAVVVIVFNTMYYIDALDIIHDETFMNAWYQRAFDAESLTSASTNYSKNTGMFILGYILCFVVIVGCVLLVLNLLWKRKLMKGEKALLEQSFAQEVA